MKYAFKRPVYILSALIFDIIGTVIFFPLRLFRSRPPLRPINILVVRLDHIGDFVCTSPVFKNIKDKFPESKITALVNSASKELAYKDPHIDKVITFSPAYLARGDRPSTFNGFLRVVKDVRNIGFDLGIEPRGDLLSILIMWFGGVKFRIGYGITGGGFLLNREARYDKSIHVIDRNLSLIKDIGVPIKCKSANAYFDEKDIAVVDEIVKGLKMDANIKGLVLHPFAGALSRGWGAGNFQNLIDKLKTGGFTVFIIGAKDEGCDYRNAIDMRGKFNLPQLAYFIKHIGCFIGLNSGPANIAAALGVPSVVISSGTNIIEDWIPPDKNVKFVYKEIACRPCEKKICPKERYECMHGITADDVMSKLKEIREDIF